MHKSLDLKKEAIIHLHIPKTAGSTLAQILFRQAKRSQIITTRFTPPLQVIEDIKTKYSPEQLVRTKVVTGHMLFGLHEHLPMPAKYVSMLREPVDRLVSFYFFVLDRPGHYLYDWVAKNNVGFDEFVRSGITPELDNAQTRVISGVQTAYGEHPARMYENALKNVQQHFIFLGTMERFDEFLLAMKFMGGLKHIYYRRANISRKRPQRIIVSEETRKFILEQNKMDIELYNYASTQFEELIKSIPDFQRKLNRFRVNNMRFGTLFDLIYKAYFKFGG